jgi:hypothetical protein
MYQRGPMTLAASSLVMLLVGCTTKPPPPPSPTHSGRPDKQGQVTLHVEGMTKVQGIT